MISVNTSVRNSPKRIKGDIDMYQKYLGRLTMECVRHEAAMCALGFIRFTPPFKVRNADTDKGVSGLGKDDEAIGNRAIERDVRSMFAPIDSTLRGAVDPFYGSMSAFMAWKRKSLPANSGNIVRKIWESDAPPEVAMQHARNLYANANRSKMLEGPSQMRAIHNSQLRRYRGRITRHNGPSDDIKKSKYLVEPSIITRYVMERQKKVGWMKSAWAKIISHIGTVNFNGRNVRPTGGTHVGKWITRHGQGGGGNVTQDYGRKSVRITNSVGDSDGVSSTADVVDFVINWRNLCLSSRPYQSEVDKSLRLWNAERIKAYYI